MNRATLREELQTVLKEPVGGDYWSPAQMNRYLNLGLAFMGKKILLVHPTAFIFEDSFGLTQNVDLYPVPEGCITVLRLSANGNRLRRQHEAVVARENGPIGVGTGVKYPHQYGPIGRYLRVGGRPNETIADAMRIMYVPTLAMATDTDTPGIEENLQMGIVYKAAMYALSGTAEKDQMALMMTLLADVIEDIDTYYRPIADSTASIRPDYDIIDGDDPRGYLT